MHGLSRASALVTEAAKQLGTTRAKLVEAIEKLRPREVVELGRHRADAPRRLRQLDRHARHVHLAGDRVGDFHQHLALPQMRIEH